MVSLLSLVSTELVSSSIDRFGISVTERYTDHQQMLAGKLRIKQ
jgi:hypothetical protein